MKKKVSKTNTFAIKNLCSCKKCLNGNLILPYLEDNFEIVLVLTKQCITVHHKLYFVALFFAGKWATEMKEDEKSLWGVDEWFSVIFFHPDRSLFQFKMGDESGNSVKVAVRIRPQMPREIIDACKVNFLSKTTYVTDWMWWTWPLVCLSLFSVMFWTRVSTSIWNLSLPTLVSKIKRHSRRRVKQFISFDGNDISRWIDASFWTLAKEHKE